MRIIYCDNGFTFKEVDYMYEEEYTVAKNNLLSTVLISFEALKVGDIKSALRNVKPSEERELGIFRGWMLTPIQYNILYDALLDKNIILINNPSEYKFCHYLPENYKTIKEYTPKTTFKKLNTKFKIDDFQKELDVFRDGPIVLKDYVKSQKHYWEDACFIPKASDRLKANEVITKFLELQDTDLNEGLVFREYVELEWLTNHSKSGMPLTKEFRLFVMHGEVIGMYKYWDEGNYQKVKPIVKEFKHLIPKIKSNFFTMDIAQKKNGDWIVIELGDGQVAGLPDNADKNQFYSAIKGVQNI